MPPKISFTTTIIPTPAAVARVPGLNLEPEVDPGVEVTGGTVPPGGVPPPPVGVRPAGRVAGAASTGLGKGGLTEPNLKS